MGRTVPTSTMRVYQFERDWKVLARSPRQVEREAFAELCAFAHFHAAPVAHAASPFVFEMILLTMLVGLVRRAEALQQQGILQFYAAPSSPLEGAPSFQTNLIAVMAELRRRLATQRQELLSFGRALRREDQHAFEVLLAVTQPRGTSLSSVSHPPSNELLLASLVRLMRRIRRLEKQYQTDRAIVSMEDWTKACTVT